MECVVNHRFSAAQDTLGGALGRPVVATRKIRVEIRQGLLADRAQELLQFHRTAPANGVRPGVSERVKANKPQPATFIAANSDPQGSRQ